MHPSALTSIFYLFNESMYQTVLSAEGKGQGEHWYWWQQVDLAEKDRSDWPEQHFPLAACCKRPEHCPLSAWLLMLTPELVSAVALECHSAWPAWHLWHVINFDWKLWQIETLDTFQCLFRQFSFSNLLRVRWVPIWWKNSARPKTFWI